MKTPLSRLALVFTGLALSFAACDNRDVVAAPATEESSTTGKVAFRLSDTLLQVVGQTSDSVRIEAVREGFATRTVTGSIVGITHLGNLEPGAWTLKIATYDTLRAVSWYGESVAQIKAGSTVDAVVVLRRASGSVNVHIVLDTLPLVADTVTVKYAQGNLSDYKPLPVDGAWRTDAGIYIATRYDYFAPVVVATPTQTMYPQELTLAGKPLATLVAAKRLPHVVFVPFPSHWSVSIANLVDDSIIELPGKPVVVDPPSTVDTLTINLREGKPADSIRLPVEGAWRTDKGIYIATRFDYFLPSVVHFAMQSSRPRRVFLIGTPIKAFAAMKLLPHIVFVPFPANEDVIVDGGAGDSSYTLPGNHDVVPVKDSSFVQYSRIESSGWTHSLDVITLRADGKVQRETRNPLVDTTTAILKASIPADTLGWIRRLLEASSTRRPGGFPTITQDCPTDLPTVKRQTIYADGRSSSTSWSGSSYCGEMPAFWTALDPLDTFLLGLFAK